MFDVVMTIVIARNLWTKENFILSFLLEKVLSLHSEMSNAEPFGVKSRTHKLQRRFIFLLSNKKL
jgi:hypothetical protein